MKQKLLKTMLLLGALVVGLGNVWADEEVCYTLTPASGSNNSYAGNCDIAIDGITWNLTGNSTYQPWRIGGKSLSSVDRKLYSKTYISDNITKIKVTHGEASSITVNSWTVVVSKNSDFSDPVSTLTPTFAANTTTTINRPDGKDWSNCYYQFIYNVTVSVSSNKFIQFTEAEFYKESAGGSTDCDLALTGDPIELEFDLYDDSDAKVINYTTSSTGTVTVSASDYINAVVNTELKTITVTPLKKTASAQTITVNQTADATYAAGSTTFTVSIDDSTPTETFKRITSADDLATGDELIFVYETDGKAAGTIGSNKYLSLVSVDIDTDEIEVASGSAVNVFVLGGKSGVWTLYSKMDNGYLKEASTDLYIESEGSTWTIGFSGNNAIVTSTTKLQYNSSSPRFKTYSSTQKDIQLYRKVVDRTTLSVGAVGYTTYVTKGKVAFPSGVKAYIATAVSGGSVTLQEVASAPANTAVIIEADEDDYYLSSAASPADCSGNILKASNGYMTGDGSTIFALGNKGGVGFYLVKSGVAVPAGKAYLEVTGGGVKEFLTFDFGDDADGIVSPLVETEEGAAIYNLAGQRLQKMQKGINIVNGKKILF